MSPVPFTYSHKAEVRQQLRDKYAEEIRLKAEREAHQRGLSLRCLWKDHGCLNDGSTCLCRCHDK